MNAIINDSAANLNEEIQAFRDLAKDFSTKVLVEECEEHDKFPFGELYTKGINDASIVGFYGVNLPADFGGVGMNTTMVAVILERISQVDASMAGVIFTNAAALEILRIAESEKAAGIYTGISSAGTAPIAFQSYAGPLEIEMPEVDAGSDTVSGKAEYLVLGDIADYAVLPARKKGEDGFSYYLIGLKDASIEKSKPVVSLGLHSCPAVDIVLKNTKGTIIGSPGSGQRYFQLMQAGMSVCSAAMHLGIMKGSFMEALQYAADRYQGGRQIIDWGQVRMMLANMAIETKIAESCVQAACHDINAGAPGWDKTALAAAIHIGELAVRSTIDGVQLLGGNGYMKDYGQEKRMRDAKQVQCLMGMSPLRKMEYIARIIDESK